MASRKAVDSVFASLLRLTVVLAFLQVAASVHAQTAVAPTSGTGTLADPYRITELGNLVWMSVHVATAGAPGMYYQLMNDIDASDTANWNDNGTTTSLVGFPPIAGSEFSRFGGVFDGQDHKISGLVINRPSADYVGLFGRVVAGASVSNITLDGGSVRGHSYVGSLVGSSDQSTIANCHTSAKVSGALMLVGGLAGSGSHISDCSSSSDVTGVVGDSDQQFGIGGLVGSGDTIANCYATGNVTSLWNSAGGLAGDGGVITSSFAVGQVSGFSGVGGLAGGASAVAGCHATGRISGNSCVGGLLGGCRGGPLTGSYSTGEVIGTSNSIGGLVGIDFSGSMTNCYATGAVRGGLLGPIPVEIGGLVGYIRGNIIKNCFATGVVASQGDSVGGLVGQGDGFTLMRCFATGAASGDQHVGGLLGLGTDVTIANCYATGATSGTDSIGGLIGYEAFGSLISDSYAAGSVKATSSTVGGLIAFNYTGTITACFWDTQTTGQSSSPGGGTGETTALMKRQATFVGWDFANIWHIDENASYPYLFNVQQPPLTPVNSAPANGAVGVALSPKLVASVFIDRNTTDTHAASEWQVRTAASPSSWTLTAFDSGATAVALTSCTVPVGALAGLTDYLWRVRYQDNHGDWSAWSTPTTFRTQVQPPPVPTGVVASRGTFADRVRVTWTGSPGADYQVLRSTHPTTATATALGAWSPGTSVDDLTAEPHLAYYYWVRAAADATGAYASDFSAGDPGWAGAWALPSNYRGALFVVR